jgi:predicted PP-loop superfamily ATPase
VKHVVAISGGKDSTALALRLRELNPDVDYTYVCKQTRELIAALRVATVPRPNRGDRA